MSFLSAVGGGVDASGGTTVTTFTDSAGIQYQIHAFENVGTDTFTVNSGGEIDVLVVGGGGSGGSGYAGGGGAGGLIFEQAISANARSYSIQVGQGGVGVQAGSNSGQDTVFDSGGNFQRTAIGGGHGYDDSGDRAAEDGGSGGGGGYTNGTPGVGLQPTSADGGFGNDGGTHDQSVETDRVAGAGGGGATEVGGNGDLDFAGDGGDGLNVSNEFGTSFGENGVFAGGGGGGLGEINGGDPPGAGRPH